MQYKQRLRRNYRGILSLLGVVILLPLGLGLTAQALNSATRETIAFPDPLSIFHAFADLPSVTFSNRDNAATAFLVSAKRVFYATILSFLVGLFFAIVLSRWRWLWFPCQPTFDLIRSIPVTFFIPVFVTVTGSTSDFLPWVLASIPCSLIMMLQTRKGLVSIDPARIHSFLLLAGRGGTALSFRMIILPEILPDIAAGLRLACSYSIVAISVLEYMGIGSAEVGFGLYLSQLTQNSPADPRIFAAITCFGVLGLAANLGLEKAEARLSRWRLSHEDG